MADPRFFQSIKELLFLIALVIALGCVSWVVIYANLMKRFWQHRRQVPGYPARCAILATKLAIGAAIIGFIMGMLILAVVLVVYTLVYLTLGLLFPGLFVVPPSAIILPVLIISIILGSLLETRAMNRKISLYDLRILSSQKVLSYWSSP